ncbi:MAG: cupin domain-containing protein [Bacillota bacterium]
MLVRHADQAVRRRVGEGTLLTCWAAEIPQGQVLLGVGEIPPGQRIPLTGAGRHEGDELSIVTKGRLDVESGGAAASLYAGDSCHIPAGEEHWCENAGPEPVRLVWIMIPPGGRVA